MGFFSSNLNLHARCRNDAPVTFRCRDCRERVGLQQPSLTVRIRCRSLLIDILSLLALWVSCNWIRCCLFQVMENPRTNPPPKRRRRRPRKQGLRQQSKKRKSGTGGNSTERKRKNSMVIQATRVAIDTQGWGSAGWRTFQGSSRQLRNNNLRQRASQYHKTLVQYNK